MRILVVCGDLLTWMVLASGRSIKLGLLSAARRVELRVMVTFITSSVAILHPMAFAGKMR